MWRSTGCVGRRQLGDAWRPGSCWGVWVQRLGSPAPGDERMRRLTIYALGAFAVVGIALWAASGVAHACDPKTGEGCSTTSTQQPASGGSTNESTTTTTTTTPKQPSVAGSTDEPGTTTTRPSLATPTTEPETTTSTSEPPTTTSTTQPPVTTPTSTGGRGGFPTAPVAAGVVGLAGLAGLASLASGSPPVPAEAAERTNLFEVRVTSGFSVSGVVVGVTVLNVEVRPILSDGPGRAKKLQFIGGGLSIGLKVGGTGPTDWEQIQTPRLMTANEVGGMGGVMSYPSATWGSHGGSLGMHLNFGGPKGTGNVYVDPQGRSFGATVIGAQGGYWRSR
jgi:hypothetical protein